MAAFTVAVVLTSLACAPVQASVDSPLRKELIDELRSARQQEMPEGAASAARYEIMDELRTLRMQMEPAAENKDSSSPMRKEIIAELRNARKQAEQEDQAKQPWPRPPASVDKDQEELPWNDAEELLSEADVAKADVAAPASAMGESMQALNRLLRTLVLSGTALGLAAAGKLPELDLKKQAVGPSQAATLALFFVPLVLVSADYLFDLSVGNELGLIACCWGLAALAAVHGRHQEEKAGK